MSKGITPEQKQKIIKLWQENNDEKETAKAFGLHWLTVHRFLIEAGVLQPAHKNRGKITPEEKLELIKYYQKTLDYKKTAEKFERSVVSVRNTIIKMGYGVTRYNLDDNLHRISDSTKVIVELLKNSKLSEAEIAKQIGVSKQRVSQIKLKYKLRENHSPRLSQLEIRNAQIIDAYKNYVTLEQLKETFCLTEQTLKRILSDNNIVVPAKDFFNQETKEKVIELYKQGLTQRKIAELMNMAQVSVRKILKNGNVKREVKVKREARRGGKFDTKLKTQIFEMSAQGISQNQIAKQLNIAQASVSRILKSLPISNPIT